jgi:Mrp family chromosome partitioning ATPase
MGKIYEALEQAQRERAGKETRFPDPPPGNVPDTYAEPVYHREMAILYQHIDSMLGGSPKKVIQFIAAREGEGTSTIVREFARTSATILGKSVFLFDADPLNFRPALEGPDSGNGSRSGDPDAEDAIVTRDSPPSTAVCLIPQNSEGIRKHFYSPQIDSFWEGLRQNFDLVLIDSPPFETSPDGLAISRRVDGVILVLEAEKTRWPVAERLKEQVQSNGGNILGIVFNKRRYYIPEFVYKRI